jgi:hypothetical protein
MQFDLFAPPRRVCGACRHLGPEIESGVRYCPATCTWQWAHLETPCANHSGDER